MIAFEYVILYDLFYFGLKFKLEIHILTYDIIFQTLTCCGMSIYMATCCGMLKYVRGYRAMATVRYIIKECNK
jgi:hypothetical protein